MQKKVCIRNKLNARGALGPPICFRIITFKNITCFVCLQMLSSIQPDSVASKHELTCFFENLTKTYSVVCNFTPSKTIDTISLLITNGRDNSLVILNQDTSSNIVNPTLGVLALPEYEIQTHTHIMSPLNNNKVLVYHLIPLSTINCI